MSITFEQALNASVFHEDGCTVSYGKTGRAHPDVKLIAWRRNGATQTWKTRPGAFRIPVKHGMYEYGAIYENEHVHVADDCPALLEAEAWWRTKQEGA